MVSVFFILVSQSCMMGDNFKKIEYQCPQSYSIESTLNDTIINLKWWELIDDEVLDTLITVAIENNKDVRVAAERIEMAKANLGYTAADQWPSLVFGTDISVAGIKGTSTSSFAMFPQFNWEIGFWGKYRRLNEAAQADFLSTMYAKRMIQQSLISTVAATYFTISANYEQLHITEQTLASRNSALLIMQDKYEGGMISQMDLNQAKIQRDIAATKIPKYKRAIELNKNALNILLGRFPQNIGQGKPFSEQASELDVPYGIPSTLLERRPDILQVEQAYHSKLAQVGVAEAVRFPSLNLTGLLGLASTDLTNLNAFGLGWSVGGTLLGPVFQFGKNKKRVEMAQADANAALLNYEKTVQQAFREVEDALVKISTYKEELVAMKSQTKTAVESESLAYIRYDEGSTTYLEVLEQQRQSFSAQLELSSVKLNLLNSYIFLYKALGGGWISKTEEQKSTIK
jgi:multidrug efflux system outer membrane protein